MSRRKFYSNSKKRPKAKLKKTWKRIIDPKWRYQSWNNFKDGYTDMVACDYPREPGRYSINKEYMHKLKMLKHKLYFHIPLDEYDLEFIEKYPGSLEWAQRNCNNLIKRNQNER